MHLDLSTTVETIYNPGRKRFIRDFEKPGIPVVIKGLLDEQPAGEKWTMDWFRRELGHLNISLFDNRVENHNWSHTTSPDVNMSFEEYFDIICRDEYTPLRMFAANLFKIHPPLKKDFACPEIFRNPLGFLSLMFLGGYGTKVRGHFDIDRSGVLLTQVFGQKKVTLFPPEASPFLYRIPFNMHTTVEIDDPEFDIYPGLAYISGSQVIPEPGDSLYIPPGFWHFITYLNGGMGVAHRKMNRNPLMVARGVWAILFEIPFDKVMNRFFGKKWYRYKDRTSIKRVNKAISSQKSRKISPAVKKPG